MAVAENILIRPLLTEKNTKLQEERNKYVFEVHPKANKIEIEMEIKKKFPKVTINNIATMIVRGKKKRVGRAIGKRKNWKLHTFSLK